MPKIVDPDEMKREIRRAAWCAFSERGVKGVGLGHVSAVAGVGRSSLYHYYPSKDMLLFDMIDHLLSEEEQIFAQTISNEGSCTERVSKLVNALVQEFSAWLDIAPAIFDLRALHEARFCQFYSRIRQDLSALIDEGKSTGEFSSSISAEHASACIIGLLDGLLLQYVVDPKSLENMNDWKVATEQLVLRMIGK